MNQGKPDPNCRYCRGTGQVVDYVPYGDTSVPMYTECECVEYPVYIEFLTGTYGNDSGDIVLVEYEDETYLYYTDGFDRPSYIEKSLLYETFEYTDKGPGNDSINDS